MQRKVELTEILNHLSFYINDETQEITIKVDSGYSTLVELASDYGISVAGSMSISYDGMIFIGSMSNGEAIGMTLSEISEECQRRYEERQGEIQKLLAMQYNGNDCIELLGGNIYTEYSTNHLHSPMVEHFPCTTCKP